MNCSLEAEALSGFSSLIFTELQASFSKGKESPNSIVFKDSEASCCRLDRLNPAVESLVWFVADRGSEPCEDSAEANLQQQVQRGVRSGKQLLKFVFGENFEFVEDALLLTVAGRDINGVFVMGQDFVFV
jgi:hypothetical protein